MTITVKRSERFGMLPGWWWVTRKQAIKLVTEWGGRWDRVGVAGLPRLGYEVLLTEQEGTARTPHGVTFSTVRKAWLANVSGHYQLRDENNLIGWEEK